MNTPAPSNVWSQRYRLTDKVPGCLAFLMIAFVIVFFIGYFAFAGSSASRSLPSLVPSSDRNPGLELLDNRVEYGEYGDAKIVGRIQNNSGRQFTYVQVLYNIYNRSGDQIGTAMANINNLEAGGTWKFEAIPYPQKFSDFKFKSVTGF